MSGNKHMYTRVQASLGRSQTNQREGELARDEDTASSLHAAYQDLARRGADPNGMMPSDRLQAEWWSERLKQLDALLFAPQYLDVEPGLARQRAALVSEYVKQSQYWLFLVLLQETGKTDLSPGQLEAWADLCMDSCYRAANAWREAANPNAAGEPVASTSSMEPVSTADVQLAAAIRTQSELTLTLHEEVLRRVLPGEREASSPEAATAAASVARGMGGIYGALGGAVLGLPAGPAGIAVGATMGARLGVEIGQKILNLAGTLFETAGSWLNTSELLPPGDDFRAGLPVTDQHMMYGSLVQLFGSGSALFRDGWPSPPPPPRLALSPPPRLERSSGAYEHDEAKRKANKKWQVDNHPDIIRYRAKYGKEKGQAGTQTEKAPVMNATDVPDVVSSAGNSHDTYTYTSLLPPASLALNSRAGYGVGAAFALAGVGYAVHTLWKYFAGPYLGLVGPELRSMEDIDPAVLYGGENDAQEPRAASRDRTSPALRESKEISTLPDAPGNSLQTGGYVGILTQKTEPDSTTQGRGLVLSTTFDYDQMPGDEPAAADRETGEGSSPVATSGIHVGHLRQRVQKWFDTATVRDQHRPQKLMRISNWRDGDYTTLGGSLARDYRIGGSDSDLKENVRKTILSTLLSSVSDAFLDVMQSFLSSFPNTESLQLNFSRVSSEDMAYINNEIEKQASAIVATPSFPNTKVHPSSPSTELISRITYCVEKINEGFSHIMLALKRKLFEDVLRLYPVQLRRWYYNALILDIQEAATATPNITVVNTLIDNLARFIKTDWQIEGDDLKRNTTATKEYMRSVEEWFEQRDIKLQRDITYAFPYSALLRPNDTVLGTLLRKSFKNNNSRLLEYVLKESTYQLVKNATYPIRQAFAGSPEGYNVVPDWKADTSSIDSYLREESNKKINQSFNGSVPSSDNLADRELSAINVIQSGFRGTMKVVMHSLTEEIKGRYNERMESEITGIKGIFNGTTPLLLLKEDDGSIGNRTAIQITSRSDPEYLSIDHATGVGRVLGKDAERSVVPVTSAPMFYTLQDLADARNDNPSSIKSAAAIFQRAIPPQNLEPWLALDPRLTPLNNATVVDTVYIPSGAPGVSVINALTPAELRQTSAYRQGYAGVFYNTTSATQGSAGSNEPDDSTPLAKVILHAARAVQAEEQQRMKAGGDETKWEQWRNETTKALLVASLNDKEEEVARLKVNVTLIDDRRQEQRAYYHAVAGVGKWLAAKRKDNSSAGELTKPQARVEATRLVLQDMGYDMAPHTDEKVFNLANSLYANPQVNSTFAPELQTTEALMYLLSREPFLAHFQTGLDSQGRNLPSGALADKKWTGYRDILSAYEDAFIDPERDAFTESLYGQRLKDNQPLFGNYSTLYRAKLQEAQLKTKLEKASGTAPESQPEHAINSMADAKARIAYYKQFSDFSEKYKGLFAGNLAGSLGGESGISSLAYQKPPAVLFDLRTYHDRGIITTPNVGALVQFHIKAFITEDNELFIFNKMPDNGVMTFSKHNELMTDDLISYKKGGKLSQTQADRLVNKFLEKELSSPSYFKKLPLYARRELDSQSKFGVTEPKTTYPQQSIFSIVKEAQLKSVDAMISDMRNSALDVSRAEEIMVAIIPFGEVIQRAIYDPNYTPQAEDYILDMVDLVATAVMMGIPVVRVTRASIGAFKAAIAAGKTVSQASRSMWAVVRGSLSSVAGAAAREVAEFTLPPLSVASLGKTVVKGGWRLFGNKMISQLSGGSMHLTPGARAHNAFAGTSGVRGSADMSAYDDFMSSERFTSVTQEDIIALPGESYAYGIRGRDAQYVVLVNGDICPSVREGSERYARHPDTGKKVPVAFYDKAGWDFVDPESTGKLETLQEFLMGTEERIARPFMLDRVTGSEDTQRLSRLKAGGDDVKPVEGLPGIYYLTENPTVHYVKIGNTYYYTLERGGVRYIAVPGNTSTKRPIEAGKSGWQLPLSYLEEVDGKWVRGKPGIKGGMPPRKKQKTSGLNWGRENVESGSWSFEINKPKYDEIGTEDGPMLKEFVSNNAALRINSDYVHPYNGAGTAPGLYVSPSVFDIPVLPAGSTSKNIVVTTKVNVKESCIETTEALISTMARAEGAPKTIMRNGEEVVNPTVQFEARRKNLAKGGGEETITHNISTDDISHEKIVYKNYASIITTDAEFLGLNVGDGLAFINKRKKGNNFHFMAVVGEVRGAGGGTEGLLMTDLANVEGGKTSAVVKNYDLHVFKTLEEARGHDYADANTFFSARVSAVGNGL
ncbi:hypothetical protein KH388_22170 [Serratia rubidaea]|nr:hypothetical protein [Serratia rubidaea]